MELGLRHQGVLLTAIRGCDTAPKHDPSKLLARSFRAAVLNPFCGDARKAATFIEAVEPDAILKRFNDFARNCDHYPHHFVMHLVHAAEIVGYKHPDPSTRAYWHAFYLYLCVGLHVSPETEAELDRRLTADEDAFARRDRAGVALPGAAASVSAAEDRL